jgi:hypothetical protein
MAHDSYDGSLDLVEDGLLNGEASIAALLARSFGREEHLPPMLYRLWRGGRIGGERLREAVACTWTYNESPKKRLSEAEWIELFKAVGVIIRHDPRLSDAEAAPKDFEYMVELPSRPFRVWRGAALSTDGRGMAWSAHRECATRFARHGAEVHRTPSGVFRTTVPPNAILALLTNWHEQEVVVNPNELRGRIALVEEIAPPPEVHEASHVAAS